LPETTRRVSKSKIRIQHNAIDTIITARQKIWVKETQVIRHGCHVDPVLPPTHPYAGRGNV
jgi:hypothetical protein